MRTHVRKPSFIIKVTLVLVAVVLLVLVYLHDHPSRPYYPHVKPEGTLIASFENVRGDHVDVYQNQQRNGGWVDSWSNDTRYKPQIISFCHGYTFTREDLRFSWLAKGPDDKPIRTENTDPNIMAWILDTFHYFQYWHLNEPHSETILVWEAKFAVPEYFHDPYHNNYNEKLNCPLKVDHFNNQEPHHGNKIT